MRRRFILISTLAVALATPGAASAHELLCELGQRLSVIGDMRLDELIDLDWKGKMYRMKRVGTSTGAQRFEDRVSGLILISIPGKAMLLDGRRGEPVANECRIGHGGRSAR